MVNILKINISCFLCKILGCWNWVMGCWLYHDPSYVCVVKTSFNNTCLAACSLNPSQFYNEWCVVWYWESYNFHLEYQKLMVVALGFETEINRHHGITTTYEYQMLSMNLRTERVYHESLWPMLNTIMRKRAWTYQNHVGHHQHRDEKNSRLKHLKVEIHAYAHWPTEDHTKWNLHQYPSG